MTTRRRKSAVQVCVKATNARRRDDRERQLIVALADLVLTDLARYPILPSDAERAIADADNHVRNTGRARNAGKPKRGRAARATAARA